MSARRQACLLWGAVSAAMIALSPLAARFAATLPACLFKSLLALPCPTCGTTRAVVALARLDFGAALALNPLATLAGIVLIAGGLAAGAAAVVDRLPHLSPIRSPHGIRALRLAIALGLVINWAYLIAAGV